jgi:hypothetical protein
MRDLTILLLLVSGCSLLEVRRASRAHSCLASPTPPILDTVLAGGSLALGATTFAWARAHPEHEASLLAVLATFDLALLGIVHGVSAIYGWHELGKCGQHRRAAFTASRK